VSFNIATTFLGDQLGKLQKELAAFDELSVSVGFQREEGKTPHAGTRAKIAKIAAIHEFGNPGDGIPARSFIRDSIKQQANAINSQRAHELRRVMLGQATAVEALSGLGKFVLAIVRDRLTSGDFAALEPETAKAKGSRKPLVHTNELAAALSWVVKRRRSVIAKGK